MERWLCGESLFVGGALELLIVSAKSLMYFSEMTCLPTIASLATVLGHDLCFVGYLSNLEGER